MGRTSSDIIDYCNECLTLFPDSTVAQNTLIIIILESLLPQICKKNWLDYFRSNVFWYLDDTLAPVSKLTDALNRVRPTDTNRISAPAVCGKAFFSIRHGKYSTALESLLTVDQEEGLFLIFYSFFFSIIFIRWFSRWSIFNSNPKDSLLCAFAYY